MKITKRQLIQLIKEELEATLQGQDDLGESLQGKGLPEHISECIGKATCSVYHRLWPLLLQVAWSKL